MRGVPCDDDPLSGRRLFLEKFYEKAELPKADAEDWKGRLKRLSAAMKDYPFVYDSGISLSARAENPVCISRERGLPVACLFRV